MYKESVGVDCMQACIGVLANDRLERDAPRAIHLVMRWYDEE
jgi:hypothetical protein